MLEQAVLSYSAPVTSTIVGQDDEDEGVRHGETGETPHGLTVSNARGGGVIRDRASSSQAEQRASRKTSAAQTAPP